MAFTPNDNSDMLLKHLEHEIDLTLSAFIHIQPLELIIEKREDIFKILGFHRSDHPIFDRIIQLYRDVGWDVHQTHYNLVFKKQI